MPKIMLVDDEEQFHFALRSVATRYGYEFCSALDGESGFKMLVEQRPDILLLDVMMPGMDGFEFLRTMRDQGRKIPVIFLSAKGDIVDKRSGFKAGCDDYLVKPFNMDELFLRIEALLRRVGSDGPLRTTRSLHGEIVAGNLKLDLSGRYAEKDGGDVGLTPKEFEILALLAANPGQVFTREQIYRHIWKEESFGNHNSVTVLIRKIREKIEDDPSNPGFLLTVWHVGYKFTNAVEQGAQDASE